MSEQIEFRQAAVAMELATARFYRTLANAVDDPKVKDLLAYLTEEEENHVKVVERLADIPVQKDLLNAAFQDAGEIMACLSTDYRRDVQACAGAMNNRQEVLRLAMGMEKDAILFYHTLLRHIDRPELAEQIDKMIETEYVHLSRLAKLMNVIRREEGADRGAPAA